jgi:hypothetical protein
MTKLKRIMRKFRINEISAVDRPAQEDATVAIMKRNSVVGPSVAVKRALGLDATATEADCIRVVQQMGRRALENDPAVRAELRKLRSSDVGRASLEPKSTELVRVTDATAASTVRTAYEQIKGDRAGNQGGQ